VHESLQASNLEVLNFCKEKDFEVCSVNVYLPTFTIGIVNIHRSPSGNFNYFIKEIESILVLLSRKSKVLIVCGDFNINFRGDTTYKRILTSLMATFGMHPTVDFPTRIYNNSITTIDNIFINTINLNSYSVYPCIKGLSDHDVQLMVLHDIVNMTYKKHSFLCQRFNEETISDFNIKTILGIMGGGTFL